MHYISKAEKWAIDLYPENNTDFEYKVSDYAIIEKYRDGYIVFHTITWSMYFLSNEEFDNILSNKQLIKNRVVLSNNINEDEIAEKAYLKRSVRPEKSHYESINSFVIFTTNECNANCYYCYEKIKKGSMSFFVADKIVEFIKNKNAKKEVHIRWFGGEPLKNIPIIDYITNKLKSQDFFVESSMITNGSLFTKEVLDKAICDWNLKTIQTTIDGPEEVYNKTKNYNDIENAFHTVIDNVLYIAKNSNIRILIRINISHENIDYIEELVNYINSILVENNITNVNLTFNIIYQIQNDIELLKKDDFEKKFNYLENKYLPNENNKLFKKAGLTRCMADNFNGVAITPDGNIYNCEHAKKENLIGNVFDGITRTEAITDAINKGGKNIEYCLENKCKLIPVCYRCNFCENVKRCTDTDRIDYENNLVIEKLKYTVDYYFKKLKEKSQPN